MNRVVKLARAHSIDVIARAALWKRRRMIDNIIHEIDERIELSFQLWKGL